MNIIVCVDSELGMIFNNRRQSRDKNLLKYILQNLKNKNLKLYINNFSKLLFEDYIEEYKDIIILDENFLNDAGKEEYCFVENVSLKDYQERVNKIIMFDWNTRYPKDKYLDIDLSKFKLESTKEIVGNSHEKIIEKIYKG